MRRLSRFRALSSGDKSRLLLAGLALLAIRIGLIVVPFSRLRGVLRRLTAGGTDRLPGSPSPERVVWAVEVADRLLPGERTCLMRSLAAETLLRLDAYTYQHRIGVSKRDDGTFEAHSWIEREGEILIGQLDDIARYEPLPPLDERSRP